MEDMLKAAVQSGAQSLLVKAGDVFRARVDGRLVRLSETPFTAEDTRRMAKRVLPDDVDEERLDELHDLDFSWELKDTARFRVNLLRQRGTIMLVMRVLPWTIPSFEDLRLPPILADLADLEHGLILVTGATGSGKSTTQAAMVDWINRNRQKHVITLEDPIEYRHENRTGSVTQREVGRDTDRFRTGLRMALRQDPDVILIGEMRDAETLETALEAGETGQLVVSTYHAATAVGTLGRLLAMLKGEEDPFVRKRISEVLRAVVSQKLLPRRQEAGRVPVVEILRMTGAVQEAILRDEPREEIRRLMEVGGQYGMQTFDQHLKELVQAGTVDFDVAHGAATSPSDFELEMQTLGGIGGDDPGGEPAAETEEDDDWFEPGGEGGFH